MIRFSMAAAFLLVALLAVQPALAQVDENYSFNAGDSEGFFGETALMLFYGGVSGDADAISGFQWSACHDEALSIGEEDVERGESIVDLEFDTFVVEVYDSGWTVAAILSGDETLTGELELMAATYSIDDDVELACVEFCDLEDVPPLVIVGDDEIEPVTDEGCIEVLFEEESEYLFIAGDSEGFFEETATVPFHLIQIGDAVNGYEFFACHDEALSLGEEALVQGDGLEGVDFEFETISVEDTYWSVAALLSGDGVLEGEEVHLYDVTYNIDDDVEIAEIDFCEGQTVTVGDEEVEAEAENGLIEVLFDDGGGGESEYLLVAGVTEGFFEETAVMPFHLVQEGDAVNGWTWFACHDEALSLVDEAVEQGEGLEGLEFDFETIEIEDTYWSVSALLSGDGALEGEEVHMYNVTYEIVDDVEVAAVEFCEDHTVTVGDDEIEAATEDGAVEVLYDDDGGGEENDDLVLFASEAVGAVGGQVDISVWFDNFSDMSVAGYQFALCHGENVDVEDEDSIASGAATAEFEFTFEAINVAEGYWNVGAVLDAEGEDLLEPAKEAQELYVATYDLLEVGEEVLEFCGEGLTPEEIVLVVGDDDVYPATENGFIEITDEPGFRRGDVNGNGQTFPLLDAIDLFNWAFGDGEAPPCMDAADTDDSGVVFGLVDGIFLLNWAFNNMDEPPSPGPSECGSDPTEDDITCLEGFCD